MERSLSEHATLTQINNDTAFEEDGKHSESKGCLGRAEDDELRQMKLMYTISVQHMMNGATEKSNTEANLRSNRFILLGNSRFTYLVSLGVYYIF